MIKEDMYKIMYLDDELSIERTDCKQPWNCTCELDTDEVKCGYSPQEIQEQVVKYYENRASYIKSLSTEKFMEDYGIYL